MTQAKMFKTNVAGVGPFCVEFPDGEIVTTRSEDRQRLIARIEPVADLLSSAQVMQKMREYCNAHGNSKLVPLMEEAFARDGQFPPAVMASLKLRPVTAWRRVAGSPLCNVEGKQAQK